MSILDGGHRPWFVRCEYVAQVGSLTWRSHYMYILTYTHTYIHPYLHTPIHIHIHTYTHTHISSMAVLTCIHTYIIHT